MIKCKEVQVGRGGSVDKLQLSNKEIAERSNVGKVEEEHLLHERTGNANNKEGNVRFCARFVVRED
jgi:hypothetical protein